MREKNHRPQDVDRYIGLLQDISAYSLEKTADNDISLRDIIKRCGVSNSAEFALKKLNVIKKETDFKWTYEWGTPTASHAKQILDFNLSWRKKKAQQPTLSPDWQTLVEKLTTISQDLKELLKPEINGIGESDAMQELRNKIAGAIGGGIYAKCFTERPTQSNLMCDIADTNAIIILATNDLITKLYKK